MKKLLVLLAFILLIPSTAFANGDVPPILVYVRGENVEFSEESGMINRDGRICLPVRTLSEKLGYAVQWNEEKREVRLERAGRAVTFGIDKVRYRAGNEEHKLDVAPFIEGDRTYLPMRFLGEALGEKVVWDEAQRLALFGAFPKAGDVCGNRIDVSDGYHFTIPEELEQVIVCKNEDNGIKFCEKKNADAGEGGYLGNFAVVDRPDNSGIGYLLGKIGDKYLMFYYPGDVNYNPENKELTEAYKKAWKEVPKVLQTVEIDKAK